jgi:hypothetical protein
MIFIETDFHKIVDIFAAFILVNVFSELDSKYFN